MERQNRRQPDLTRSAYDSSEEFDPLSNRVIGCALEVHKTLGPGLLESVYEECLCMELAAAGMRFDTQVQQQIFYKGSATGGVLRPDLIIEDVICVEIKAVETLLAVHRAQLHTYLKVLKLNLGLLINFNSYYLRDGIKRVTTSGNL